MSDESDDTDFDAILAATTRAATRPRARQAAAFARLGLTPEQKVSALLGFMMRTFFQETRGQPMDRLAWVFANAAIGAREVLPWQRGDVAHVLRATAARPASLPPAVVARALDQFAAARGGTLPAEMRRWARQAADALAAAVPGNAATARAVARLRAHGPPHVAAARAS